ncbi:ferredoxin [Candidatus Saccharibacteria bacterium]|nr:ferredoxin [Candidatus Saccharibacteria bacterium]
MANLEVLIDQDECTSCQECTMIAPRHFFMASDNLAYVKEDSSKDPDVPAVAGFSGRVAVASDIEEDVIEAAEYCPGECIYVVPVDSPPLV